MTEAKSATGIKAIRIANRSDALEALDASLKLNIRFLTKDLQEMCFRTTATRQLHTTTLSGIMAADKQAVGYSLETDLKKISELAMAVVHAETAEAKAGEELKMVELQLVDLQSYQKTVADRTSMAQAERAALRAERPKRARRMGTGPGPYA